MLPNDMSHIADGIAKPEASNADLYTHDQGSTGPARNLIRRTYVLRKEAADAMAADVTAYTAADHMRMRTAGRILGASIAPRAALTAAADCAVVNVVKGDGAAGAATVMASVTTTVAGSGDWVAGRLEPMTISATVANTRIARGEVLGFNIAKTGAGVVVPICAISVDIEEEGTDAYAV